MALSSGMAQGPAFDTGFNERLLTLIDWRRDVRRFRPDPLPPNTVARLVEIASLAPSVGLSQPWRFVTVCDPARRAAIRRNFERANEAALKAQDQSRAALYARLKLAGLDDAPVHLAVFADRTTQQGHGLGRQTMPEMLDYSVAVAIHTLWLAARAQGIGVGWVSILDAAEVAATLDIDAAWKLIGYLCIGYPLIEDDTPALQREGWEERRLAERFLIER